MMGLEEHLLQLFKDDFEFGNGATPSHLGHGSGVATAGAPVVAAPAAAAPIVAAPIVAAPIVAAPIVAAPVVATPVSVPVSSPAATPADGARWTPDAERELGKIPFFVRGKARRNTERYAAEQGVASISVETLYDAKAHFGR
jgi:light-independent protochlorophyllide reductase subunit B